MLGCILSAMVSTSFHTYVLTGRSAANLSVDGERISLFSRHLTLTSGPLSGTRWAMSARLPDAMRQFGTSFRHLRNSPKCFRHRLWQFYGCTEQRVPHFSSSTDCLYSSAVSADVTHDFPTTTFSYKNTFIPSTFAVTLIFSTIVLFYIFYSTTVVHS